MNNSDASPVEQNNQNKVSWSFVAFMLALTALFAYLGNWQVNRLAQKESMIAAVEERIGLQAVDLPPIAEWGGFDAETYNFRPITVSGTFDHAHTVRVFTSLADANGIYSGPGYWVVAPFMLKNGGMIFVNRGFVPEQLAPRFKEGGAGPISEVILTGIGRVSEPVNTFTPGADFQNHIDWVRNIERLTQFLDGQEVTTVPLYLDASAGEVGMLPQGGETKLTIINRHFEYALTWYALALLTPILLLFWWRKTVRKPAQ